MQLDGAAIAEIHLHISMLHIRVNIAFLDAAWRRSVCRGQQLYRRAEEDAHVHIVWAQDTEYIHAHVAS